MAFTKCRTWFCLSFLVLMSTFVNTPLYAQPASLFVDDFEDNTNNWSLFEEVSPPLQEYVRIENGALVFSKTDDFNSSDIAKHFIVPQDAVNSGDVLYPPYTTTVDIASATCSNTSCELWIAIGYTSEEVHYLVIDHDRLEINSAGPNDDRQVLFTSRTFDSASLPEGINIFDGQPHRLTLDVTSTGGTIRIDDAFEYTMDISELGIQFYNPIGLPGFAMDFSRANIRVQIDRVEVTGSDESLVPSATPIPATPIPTPVIQGAGQNGISAEQLTTLPGDGVVNIAFSDDGTRTAFIYSQGAEILGTDGSQFVVQSPNLPIIGGGLFPPVEETFLFVGGNANQTMFESVEIATSASIGFVANLSFAILVDEGYGVEVQGNSGALMNNTDGLIAVLTNFGLLQVWHSGNQFAEQIAYTNVFAGTYGVFDFDFNDDGSLLATGGALSSLDIWSGSLDDPFISLDPPRNVRYLDFRPGTNELVYTSCDDDVCTTGTRVIDAETGEELFALDRGLTPVQYTSDGRFIIGFEAGGMSFVDANDGTYLGSLNILDDLDISSGGLLDAVAGTGNTVVEVGPVVNNSFLLYVNYCARSDLLGCSSREIAVYRVRLEEPEPTNTPGPSPTPTQTFTPTITLTPSSTFTPSATPTASDTPTATHTPTITPTPSNTSTPTATFTPTITLTPTSTLVPCTITASGSINLRSGPGTDFDVRGQLAAGQQQMVNAQETGADGFVWWRLPDGTWVRSDTVSESGQCDELPSASSELAPTLAATPVVECNLTTRFGVNLRSEPSTSGAQLGSRPAGDTFAADAQSTDSAGFIWWRVADGSIDDGLWVREDLVITAGACASLPPPE